MRPLFLRSHSEPPACTQLTLDTLIGGPTGIHFTLDDLQGTHRHIQPLERTFEAAFLAEPNFSLATQATTDRADTVNFVCLRSSRIHTAFSVTFSDRYQ